jgi:hypothetical protein
MTRSSKAFRQIPQENIPVPIQEQLIVELY